MNKILTISIAAYNVEKYLKKLLDTITETSGFELIEVLIINDGSTDKTEYIGRLYQTRYPESIRLINKKNGGHGSTINKGIKESSGLYFKAIDGDDWVNSLGLSLLVEKLKFDDADLIISDFIKVYEKNKNEKVTRINLEPDKLYKFDDIYNHLDKLCYHNIFIKTSILKDHSIRLQEKCFYVDNELDCYPLPYIDTVKYYNEVVYCYRLGREEQSVSIKNLQNNISQMQIVINNLITFYVNNIDNLSYGKKEFLSSFIANLVSFQLEILFSFPLTIINARRIFCFDNEIKKIPDIYEKERAKTINVWRKNRLLFFLLAWVRIQYKTLNK